MCSVPVLSEKKEQKNALLCLRSKRFMPQQGASYFPQENASYFCGLDTQKRARHKVLHSINVHVDRAIGECYLLNRGFAVVLTQKQLALI